MQERKKVTGGPEMLKGWQQITEFLGQPVSVAQRWADSGMPVEKRGRYVYSTRDELNRWLGRESAGEPVQIPTEQPDLSAELKRGLSFIREHHPRKPKKTAAPKAQADLTVIRARARLVERARLW